MGSAGCGSLDVLQEGLLMCKEDEVRSGECEHFGGVCRMAKALEDVSMWMRFGLSGRLSRAS